MLEFSTSDLIRKELEDLPKKIQESFYKIEPYDTRGLIFYYIHH